MTEALQKAAEAVPALLVLVFIVVMFLRHLASESQDRRDHDERQEKMRREHESKRDERLSSVIISTDNTLARSNELHAQVSVLLNDVRKDVRRNGG